MHVGRLKNPSTLTTLSVRLSRLAKCYFDLLFSFFAVKLSVETTTTLTVEELAGWEIDPLLNFQDLSSLGLSCPIYKI